MGCIPDESVHLIVTSPPYPMIEMWDLDFTALDSSIQKDMAAGDGAAVFEKMHCLLDEVWRECFRVVVPGGIVCINIGDATRSIDGRFRLYSNHSRIVSLFEKIGFESLPLILWRKQTNAPTKFMGSGMLPGGAYVTLEHEYILIFRKGGKRVFKTDEARKLRRRSALFWEERNKWFSDVWDFKGTRQSLKGGKNDGLRGRSAAYPFELAYRLVHMYSLQGETVMDPFLGTGTTILAAMAGGRNSAGFEINAGLESHIQEILTGGKPELNEYNLRRLQCHKDFIESRRSSGGKLGHENRFYNFPVVTSQETELEIPMVENIIPVENGFRVIHCNHIDEDTPVAGVSFSS